MAGRRSASRQARWARGPIPCSPGLRRPEASMFGEVSNLSLFYTPPFSVELDAYCTVRPSRVTCHVKYHAGSGVQGRPGWRIETSLRRKGVRGGGSRRACGAKPSGVEDRDEPAARQCACGKRERRVQAEPLSAADSRARAWMGQGGGEGADAPHASSRARRVERRLVGASDGAFGCRNASTACQRDVDGSIQATCIVTGW